MDVLSFRLVPDRFWRLVKPLLPECAVGSQGGGTASVDDRVVCTAVVFVLTTRCGWRELPPSFGVSYQTAHRRFTAWTADGVSGKLHRAVVDELGRRGEIDWTSAIIDAASIRAKKRGTLTGPNPIDRTKPGATTHVLTDAQGTPPVNP